MKVITSRLWLVSAELMAIAFLAGCNNRSPASLQNPRLNNGNYTQSQLTNLIVEGMSMADVTSKFGSPDSVREIVPGIDLWLYSFPIQEGKTEPHLGGFSIQVKDGKVMKWSPIMEESTQTVSGGRAQGSFGAKSFQLFLATDNLTNIANIVESKGVADAANLKAPPSLEFEAQVFAGDSGNERPGEQTVVLVVTDQVASKLKELSENNFGKQLLIVCHNEVIAAPVISGPLASRQLIFKVKNPSALGVLQNSGAH